MSQHNHNHALAVEFARLGYAVLPLDARKRPMIPGGFKSASTDEAQIHRWWQQRASAIVGLACRGFWVLDVDRPCGGTLEGVRAALEDLNLAWVLDRCGFAVSTPSGGAHLYFAHIPLVPVKTTVSDVAPGLDVRGHRADGSPTAYITAPGSMRPDGARYDVIEGAIDMVMTPAPRLLAMVSFNKRERAEIAAHASLRASINSAPIDTWRALFDEHVAQLATILRTPLLAADAGPLRKQACADLYERATRLAGTLDGRKGEAFRAAAALGRYTANGVLTEAEVTAELLNAWVACGGSAKHGEKYGRQQIANGLKIARNDPLPPIARRFRDFEREGTPA